jgi:hypothetical protein
MLTQFYFEMPRISGLSKALNVLVKMFRPIVQIGIIVCDTARITFEMLLYNMKPDHRREQAYIKLY